MRLIKAFFTGAIGLFIIITLFSLLIPSRVRVSRAVMINGTSSGEIYSQIVSFENWKNWHPIFTVDSSRLHCDSPAIAGMVSSCHILHHNQDILISLLSADSTSVKFLLQSAGEN